MKTTILTIKGYSTKRQKENGSPSTKTGWHNCWLFFLLILVLSCKSPEKKNESDNGLSLGKITYDSFILNNNPEDSWADECLAGFDRKAFIDKTFNSINSGKLVALNYFSGEKITPSKLKEMEKAGEFSQDKIAKIQFEEEWLWNEQQNILQKKVISMTFAYEVFNNTGESRGYKPAFKIAFQ
jgi:hypothetical protein